MTFLFLMPATENMQVENAAPQLKQMADGIIGSKIMMTGSQNF